MLHKTRGIVFKFIRYRESSIITTILTEAFGIQSYIVNSVRMKRPKVSIALFQPLTLLDMVVYFKENASLNRVSEIRCEFPFQSIPYNHNKSAIALFLSEVLYKSVKLESHPKEIFQFIHDSVQSLDKMESGYGNFHLQFLLKLTQFLGFFPATAHELKSQLFQNETISDDKLNGLINNEYEQKVTGISSNRRFQLLDQILDFYHLHIESLGEINSYKILREVLH